MRKNRKINEGGNQKVVQHTGEIVKSDGDMGRKPTVTSKLS